MTPPFSPARNHAEEIANVRAGFAPNSTSRPKYLHIQQSQSGALVKLPQSNSCSQSIPYRFGPNAGQSDSTRMGTF